MLALLGILLRAAVSVDSCPAVALLPAYAHNDYRNQHPLLDALDLGYRGVEADVFRVGTELLVGHERSEVRAANTLTRLYLEPLRARQHSCGYVLADRTPFFLNVELKEPDSTAFSYLVAELRGFQDLLQPSRPGDAPAVRITLVGWWPSVDETSWPPFLERQFVIRDRGITLPASSRTMGFVSIDYGKMLTWRGRGPVPASDREILAGARQLAESLGVPLRVHHVPVDREVYRWLLDQGVTLLGTSDLRRTRSLLSAPEDTASARPRAAPWALWGVMAAWGASHTAGGDAAAVAVTYQQRHRTYSLRFALAEGPPCSASDCWPDAMDLAFLLGYGTRVGGIFQASAGAGLGVANLRDDGGVALAGELQLSLRPTRFLGAAVYGWGNTVGPQFGAAFGVQIGRFR